MLVINMQKRKKGVFEGQNLQKMLRGDHKNRLVNW